MAILSGKRLGPYEIFSAIGAGGMGEVYRVRDTHLDRTAAIKIFPIILLIALNCESALTVVESDAVAGGSLTQEQPHTFYTRDRPNDDNSLISAQNLSRPTSSVLPPRTASRLFQHFPYYASQVQTIPFAQK